MTIYVCIYIYMDSTTLRRHNHVLSPHPQKIVVHVHRSQKPAAAAAAWNTLAAGSRRITASALEAQGWLTQCAEPLSCHIVLEPGWPVVVPAVNCGLQLCTSSLTGPTLTEQQVRALRTQQSLPFQIVSSPSLPIKDLMQGHAPHPSCTPQSRQPCRSV